MKGKNRKRRPHYGRIIFSLILFLGLVTLLVKLGFDLFIKEHETYLVDYGSLDIEDDYKALIIRNEIVVKTNYVGETTYYVDEGDRVIKGQAIAEIFNSGDGVSDQTETNLEINQKQIEFDYRVLESDIMTLKDNILFAIEQEHYEEIPALKEALILKLQTREKLEGENKFLSNRTSSYVEKTLGDGDLAIGEKAVLNAPAEGIVDFSLDGYEDYLTIDNIYNINYDEIDNINFGTMSIKSTYSDGQSAIIKLVDQSTFYLVISVAPEISSTFTEGKNLLVSIGSDQLEGQVYDVFSSGSGTEVVIRLKDEIETFITDRTTTCTVVNENFKGLKIHVDSIVNLNNYNGVYRVMDDRRLTFVPIQIIGYDDDYAIIQSDQFYDSEQGLMRTISASQEIIRSGAQYEEGDLID